MIFNFLVYPHFDGLIMRVFGYTFYALCFGGVLLLAVAARPATLWGRAFGLAPLRSIGKYSYGMYLFHVSFRPFLDHFFTLHKMVFWLHGFAIGILAYIVTASRDLCNGLPELAPVRKTLPQTQTILRIPRRKNGFITAPRKQKRRQKYTHFCRRLCQISSPIAGSNWNSGAGEQ
jgi:hypothetical protein